MNNIIVIGSSNTDMVVSSTHIPSPGETVLGGKFFMVGGGKGANQAVAVKRLGGKLHFIAKVGRDVFGEKSIQDYKSYGINTDSILQCDTPTGIALVMVNANGENCISVASGANYELSNKDIRSKAEEIEQSDILLMQLEIPLKSIETAAEIAQKANVKVVLNPAPAMHLPQELLEKLFLITPNEAEAEVLSGISINDLHSAKKAAEIIRKKGVTNVIITLGERGSLILNENKEFHLVEAEKVESVDSTGAGDVFSAAVCVGLAEGKDLLEAVEFATIAASVATTRMGAQSSIPSRNEVNLLIEKNH